VFRRKNSGAWWVAYCHRGKEVRESSGSESKADAQRLLKKRLGEMGRGKLIGPAEDRVAFEELAADDIRDYELKQRSVRWAKGRVANLQSHSGMFRAVDITTPRIRAYAQARLKEGATPATVNRDLAALGRMFTLAVQACRLSGRPHIPKLREAGPRQGFMEFAEYRAIREHLPADYRDALDSGYYSGWRKGEVLRLEWRDVDRAAGIIRLRPELSKNYDGRSCRSQSQCARWSSADGRLGRSSALSSSRKTSTPSATGARRGGARARQRDFPTGCSTICGARLSGISCVQA
jgi:hypothetical protein